MHTISDPQEFLANPVGSRLVTRSFVYWYPHPAFTGFALWGSPDAADIKLLNRVMDVVLPPSGGPHRSLIDMGQLTTVDPLAFRVMVEYLDRRSDAFGKLIVRQALIRPSGFAGAVVAGFYSVVTPTYPVETFAEPTAAVSWLGISDDTAVLQAVAEAREQACNADALVAQFRMVLRQEQCWSALPALARKLGVSERTLQRRLAAHKTTFQTEVRNAKLDAARALMLAGSSNLTRIALELGFASLQHFSALFRKHYGASPSTWLKHRVALNQ